MINRFILCLVTLLLVTANAAFAHQQKAAETTVLFNKNSKRLEVMHRFYLHDTEHAVKALLDKKADIIKSNKTQQQFADYVAKQFHARTLDDKELALTNVGFEVEGKFFWVYQDAVLPEQCRPSNLHDALYE